MYYYYWTGREDTPAIYIGISNLKYADDTPGLEKAKASLEEFAIELKTQS